MKFNCNNNALHLLDHIDPYAFRMYRDHENSGQAYATQVGLSVCEQFPKVASLFAKKKRFISESFDKVYNETKHSLAKVIDAEPMDESGTFIASASPSETNTIFYWIKTEGKGADFRIDAVIFSFRCHTKTDKPSLTMIVQRNNNGFKSYLPSEAIEAGLDEIGVISDIYTMLLFIKYCPIETKMIKAGKKDKVVGNKYVNETKSDIEILDSGWFTTIIRSEGFGVGGHFRMQPYGPANAMRKLIWINPFEKTGYTRTAKVLNQPI